MKKAKKKNKKSVSEIVLELGNFLDSPKTSEEIKKEIKDKKGHNIPLQDLRVNLLRLLRKEKLQRKKEGSFYKYHN
jgi:predicted transcriptional regulator